MLSTTYYINTEIIYKIPTAIQSLYPNRSKQIKSIVADNAKDVNFVLFKREENIIQGYQKFCKQNICLFQIFPDFYE